MIRTAGMKQRRRRFGPLFYVTCVVALLVLASRPFWELGADHYRARQLVGRLHDTDPDRREATGGLLQLGSVARPWVLRAMGDADPQVRRNACSILVQTAPDRPEEALTALLVAAKDTDASVRAAAMWQLEQFVARYGDLPDGKLREQALRALGDSLDDVSALVRRSAALMLTNVGPVGRPTVSNLDRALDGPDKALRVIVAAALLRIDAQVTRARVIAALSAMLTDQSIRMDHYQLVHTLIEAQGQESTAAMLIPHIKNPDLAVRIQAVNDLTTQCSDSKALRQVMLEAAFTSDDASLRGEAAVFVLKHEPAMISRAIDALADRLADPDGCDVNLIMRAREVSPRAIKALASTLGERLARESKPASRTSAMIALGAIGPDAVSAVPALLQLSNSRDLNIATRAIQSLVKIDRAAAETRLPSLLEWTSPGHDSAVRLSAMASLRDLGPAAATAIPALLSAVDEQSPTISAGAIEAVLKIDPSMGSSLKQAIQRVELGSHDDQPQ
jgi:HEAT repeats